MSYQAMSRYPEGNVSIIYPTRAGGGTNALLGRLCPYLGVGYRKQVDVLENIRIHDEAYTLLVNHSAFSS